MKTGERGAVSIQVYAECLGMATGALPEVVARLRVIIMNELSFV
jgi:hypothetical protein